MLMNMNVVLMNTTPPVKVQLIRKLIEQNIILKKLYQDIPVGYSIGNIFALNTKILVSLEMQCCLLLHNPN